MARRSAVVASKVGLHARPAATFVKAAADSGLPVTIAKDGGEPVDAASILAVMTLGAMHGDRVVVAADGEGADRVVDELATLLETEPEE